MKVNYRTSHQIREAADNLLPKSIRDIDGNEEDRWGAVSIFNGPDPESQTFDDPDREIVGIADWIRHTIQDRVESVEISVFVRTRNELARAHEAVRQAGHVSLELSEWVEEPAGRIFIGTMHLAKGLEFKAVVVMACNDEILPLQERIEMVADEADLDEVCETEHYLSMLCLHVRSMDLL